MADNPEQNDAIPDQHENEDRSTDSETEEAPLGELFLPDLNNTPLSEAVTRGFIWGSSADIIVECPKLDQIFRVKTLLVNPLSGKTKLYNRGQVDDLPVSCACQKFKETLLTTVLTDIAAQRERPLTLPGDRWQITLHESLDATSLDKRLGAFSDLVSMHARNQLDVI